MYRALLRLCLLASSLIVALPLFAAAPDAPAFGVIVGYRDAVNPLSREETDRGPWADGRARAQAAWMRAALRSRELTARVAREAGVRGEAAGEAGRAALLRFQRPLQGRALDDAMRRLRLHPDVAWVEPNVLVQRQAVPNDALYASQWHLKAPGAFGEPAGLNMENAWDLSVGSPSTVVAVVDSGIRPHPDLAGRVLPGYDFVSELLVANDGDGRDADPSDPGDWVSFSDVANQPLFASCYVDDSSWHGTFIAGQIAAETDNGQGVAGLNWRAQIVPVRVSGKCGALVSDLIDGVRWAAGLPVAGAPVNLNPARVINLSFGGSAACSPAYQSMVDDVNAAGALLVVAAGNRARSLTRPADCDGVMAVASVRRDGAKTDYSSFGPNVALSAPGGSCDAPTCDRRFMYTGLNGGDRLLLSTSNSGTTTPAADNYGYEEGTSFAAPQAAGVASLMLALNPSLTPRALIERMQAGARPHLSPVGTTCAGTSAGVCNCTTTTCGAGLLDAQVSLQLATRPAAVIRPVGTVVPGASITLDGRGSVALPGSNLVAYRWTQDSGPAVAIPADTASLTSLTLPGVEGRWVFRLTVTDNNGVSGSDAIIVRGVAPPAPAPTGGGGGPVGWMTGLVLLAAGMGLRRARRRA
ncbi:S8 family serine peptidase [Hydrogenophaga sp. T2]|uniref:S8 family peptidase n=1 Tax=Hydrogenophaga sp. T2 TaxID=3132823 RepID=UPI003CEC16F7